jgi:hypothetical protein
MALSQDGTRRVLPDAEVDACVAAPGAEHDFRRFEYLAYPRAPEKDVTLRCVWCHGVACGWAEDPDPCIEVYHHDGDHRTRTGATWPKGGDRP